MTGGGLPHSETRGSTLARQLPAAYRRLATSFLGSQRLGIHRTPSTAWPVPGPAVASACMCASLDGACHREKPRSVSVPRPTRASAAACCSPCCPCGTSSLVSLVCPPSSRRSRDDTAACRIMPPHRDDRGPSSLAHSSVVKLLAPALVARPAGTIAGSRSGTATRAGPAPLGRRSTALSSATAMR